MALAAEVLPRTFGRYTLLEHLGEGGMAEVLLARQEGIEGTQRLVALKRILPGLARDEDFVEMFLDEVRIVFGLHHPNIGHILDVGFVEGRHYLAMEYIQGRDLGQICRVLESSNGRVPLPTVVEIGRQVCAALHHAHNKTTKSGRPLNIVHRDVAPDNVIVTFDGTVKLVDFGIAIAENRISKTRAGLLKGKPPYMAPEQVLGLSVDGRADLFGLGVVLYRLITGVHPFYAAGPERIFKRIIEETPIPPSDLEPDCPLTLSRAIMKALSKDADDRHESGASFSDDLDQVAIKLGSLPTPRSIAGWLAGLFPEAAASSERALRDPGDNRAALDASYLSVSADLHEELFGERTDPLSDLVTGPGTTPRPEDRRLPSSMEDHQDEDDDDPDVKTIVQTDILEEEAPGPEVGSEMGRALAWAFEAEKEKLGPIGEDEHTKEEDAAAVPEVWSPRQHWEHLPPRLRSFPFILSASALTVLILFFALLGVRSCL